MTDERERDDRHARVPDQRGESAEQREERQAQRAQPGPETGQQHPLERRIGLGQGRALERPRVDGVAPREPRRLVRDQAHPHARTRRERAGLVRTEHEGPEPAAHADPVPRAHRGAAAVGHRAHGSAGDHDPAHAIEQGGEAGRGRREQRAARGQLDLETAGGHECGRVRPEHPHRHHREIAVPGERERLHETDALARQIGLECHDPGPRILGERGGEGQPRHVHRRPRPVKDQARLRGVFEAIEVDRGARPGAGPRAGGMACPPLHRAAALQREGHVQAIGGDPHAPGPRLVRREARAGSGHERAREDQRNEPSTGSPAPARHQR